MCCRIKLGGTLNTARVAQYWEHMPQLDSRKPFAWLNLAPWTPQWNPKCSWDPADLLKVATLAVGGDEARPYQQATLSDAHVNVQIPGGAEELKCREQPAAPDKVDYRVCFKRKTVGLPCLALEAMIPPVSQPYTVFSNWSEGSCCAGLSCACLM